MGQEVHRDISSCVSYIDHKPGLNVSTSRGCIALFAFCEQSSGRRDEAVLAELWRCSYIFLRMIWGAASMITPIVRRVIDRYMSSEVDLLDYLCSLLVRPECHQHIGSPALIGSLAHDLDT